jgi:hypothetical protein
MPSKPFRSDINNVYLVDLIDWLKASSTSVNANNNLNNRGKYIYKNLNMALDPKISSGGDKHANEAKIPKTTIICGNTGSGKTQLVSNTFFNLYCLGLLRKFSRRL